MLLGKELLVFEITDEITATQLVADAQKHPLLPQLEHVRTGDILISADPELFLIEIRMKQLTDVIPILEVLGLHHHRG